MREWLKDIQLKNNMTQQEVADKIGMTRQYYNQIETGIRKIYMDIALINNLSTTLNIPVEQIIKNESKFIEYVESIKNEARN